MDPHNILKISVIAHMSGIMQDQVLGEPLEAFYPARHFWFSSIGQQEL